MPGMKIWGVLKGQNYNQFLRPGDSARRLEFCQWMREKVNEDDEFLGKIMWTDESIFSTNGMFNRNNEHFWSIENPRQNKQVRAQGRKSFNAWVELWGTEVIGPIIYEGNLTSEWYLNLLRNQVLPHFDEVPLAVLRQLWWQQDGAPPHNGHIVSVYLNTMFQQKWIGNYGVVRWPARSPDLSPLDYFLWGYVKNNLYRNMPDNIEYLKLELRRQIRAIPRRTIQRALQKAGARIAMCIQEDGFLFEHLI